MLLPRLIAGWLAGWLAGRKATATINCFYAPRSLAASPAASFLCAVLSGDRQFRLLSIQHSTHSHTHVS
uniref:Putative secreted protein n=1 Tax=Anopheles triannulatus TaxID=58253 RepID=A0A2M4B0K8_9DIPT